MRRLGEEVHLDADEARAGDTPHIVRYVLVIGLFLAIVAMSVIWISGAVSLQPANGDPVTAEEFALGG
ncbi:MAG: hypothetical protein R3E11_09800 [Sphingobium sp.]|nr:hypothetical protein [Sphingobium sp.]MCP5399809.1 hypothetical protein [Sphingomonas sp.]